MKKLNVVILCCAWLFQTTVALKCSVGSVFTINNGCNLCICTSTGLKCTKILCVPNRCIPNTTFLSRDNCNTCFCPASGLVSEAGC
ncbi:hypothetical protein EDC96DRAFT_412336, partial [Choanephora cucurbitarum]